MQLVRTDDSLHEDARNQLGIRGKKTDAIPTNKGVQQKCCMYPTLFNTYIDEA